MTPRQFENRERLRKISDRAQGGITDLPKQMLLTEIATCTSVYTQRRRVVNPTKIRYGLHIAPLSWVSGGLRRHLDA